ncbi:defective in Cullin neddylation protein 1 [Phanerochaete sordida]|uniref:Defective in cullin neddylation protein n=1 Tax=Phanerochaete sordida TaxID=48140 RepID=A0A9P3G6J1_9APHY|nr:defective in Cullin neddylation protein 1 [Phanerochaete sordida]
MSKRVDKQLEEKINQFCMVTGASQRDARKYIEKYKGTEPALNAFYNDMSTRSTAAPSSSKLGQLFDQYKDADGDEISADGTLKFCEDLAVDPEDVVLLAVAYELKSPRMGEWTRKGWVDGWKAVGADSIPTMKTALLRLRDKLGSDPGYFQKVYNYTFEFSRPPGQRSLGMDMAKPFWGLLLPHGLQGGALSHTPSTRDGDGDDRMGGVEEGWQDAYMEWWFDFLDEKKLKGVSKDVWQMFLEFVRTIDAKFEKYDAEAAWPSTIDDFVEYARNRLASGQ